jgi:hypothetical protein
MSSSGNRRDFLRGLTTLPLIGGGVTLIGAPSAVAEPVTDELLRSYDAWLDMERRFLKWERFGNRPENTEFNGCKCVWYDPRTKRVFDFVPADNAGSRYHRSQNPLVQLQPSGRAALVLSAVGCEWKGSGL